MPTGRNVFALLNEAGGCEVEDDRAVEFLDTERARRVYENEGAILQTRDRGAPREHGRCDWHHALANQPGRRQVACSDCLSWHGFDSARVCPHGFVTARIWTDLSLTSQGTGRTLEFSPSAHR